MVRTMVENRVWLCMAGLCVVLHAAGHGAELVRQEGTVAFGGDTLQIVLDGKTGAPVRFEVGGQPVAESPDARQYFDIRQDTTWVTGNAKSEPRLLKAEQAGDNTLAATVLVGDWRVMFRYELFPGTARMRRSVVLEWHGDRDTKLKGFWMDLPSVPRRSISEVCVPGAYPPLALEKDSGVPGPGQKRSSSRSPQLLAMVGDWTWLLAHDQLTPFSDNGTASVARDDDRLRITQSFQALARLKPGDRQEIQGAWVQVEPGMDEAAGKDVLSGFLSSIGHRVPRDRPEWFRRAILYSFHPGGTIGSRFTDLGGFVPATVHLAEIAKLGCNAVWIMPIEDVGVYHPRDYYRFQQGLGTADEYRALVRTAHKLGMNLIQDIVPHGGSNHFPRAKQHPEWLAQEEDGSTLSYWCFDFNWPEWRAYMADVARHYVTQYDIDGYRVDACAGSKIPNWNPDIPYGRASFARLQGGLNMLRGLRSAVKESKPDVGGLLAETQGSVYGTVSDAVYDFSYCYSVLHDIRKTPAGVFTTRLRRWLHDQQLGETFDLLRLRHTESHDSLRSLLWYGLEPQRALMAVSSWIHGIPLVYHEMEEGSSDVFRRIFAIRRALPELSGGDADYLSVYAPCFACLRRDGDNASLVVVNLANSRVSGHAAIPGIARRPRAVWDMWRDCPVRTELRQGRLQIPLDLPPYGFTVFALRDEPAGRVRVPQDPWGAERADMPAETAPPEALQISAGGMLVTVDPTTGLPASLRVDGTEVAGAADLFLPGGLLRDPEAATVERTPAGIVSRRKLGESVLVVRYRAADNHIRIRAVWEGKPPEGDCALAIPFVDAKRWYASAAEGLFEDRCRCRHLTGEGTFGSIYWRPQGTNVVWDSLLHPFGVVAGSASCGVRTQGRNVTMTFPQGTLPTRFQWLDRVGDDRRLTALIAWSDSECLNTGGSGQAVFELSVTGPPACERYTGRGERDAWDFRPASGGWEFRNAHYRLRLSRSGVIVSYGRIGESRALMQACDVYTDGGYGKEQTRYGASNDVEAGSRIWRDGDALRLQFSGRLRGNHRFDKLDPPVSYVTSYTLDSSPAFGLGIAVRPDAPPRGEFAFLSTIFRIPSMDEVRFLSDGAELASGQTGDGKSRILETKRMTRPVLPDSIELLGADRSGVLRISHIAAPSRRRPTNVFAHGSNLFLAWQDGSPDATGASEWQSVAMVIGLPDYTPERTVSASFPATREDGDDLLRDGGFEDAACRPVSMRTRAPLPGPTLSTTWRPPAGGRLVSTGMHSGGGAAEVAGAANEYRLWRQSLPPWRMPVGSRWRLSAWVKGRNLARGDVSWKVGTVRFAVTTDRNQYISCRELLGTFDWKRVSVELEMPESVRALEVHAGPNGCAGTMWIDDVTLECLEEQPHTP